VALTVAALALALGGVIHYAQPLHALVSGWLPSVDAGAWYEWLWVGPVKLLVSLLGSLLFLLAAGVALVAAFLVANLASAPFVDALSRRVEEIVAGRVEEVAEPGLRGLLREGRAAVANELRRLLLFLAVWAALAAVGLLVPGAQVAVGPAMLLFTILFLPLDYTGYALDRRRIPFAARRRWIGRNLSLMLGFGGAAFATGLVPGLNFLLIPALVAAGTLLALRHPPLTEGQGKEADARVGRRAARRQPGEVPEPEARAMREREARPD
jgi:CysZ protein